jgi:hypothetical protein
VSAVRRARWWVPALVLAAGWSSPAAAAPGAGDVATVTVTNPLGAERQQETIAVARADVARLAPSVDFKALIVTDAAGRPVLSQLVDETGDDQPDQLVFQTDLGASQSKTFKLRAGARTPPTAADFRVQGRFVRERYDDFAWENDLVAHRVYGPGLETAAKEPLVSSGIDTWVKRVHRLVAGEWYMTGDYHRDNGEGGDFYAVGKSRGCGGIGIWAGGRLDVSRNFVSSRVLANGPIRLLFELRYAPWPVGAGVRVGQTMRVTLDAGTPWNRVESTFSPSVPTRLSAGIGIARHAGSTVAADAPSASLRAWEPLKGLAGEDAGNLGCAVVLAPGSPLEEHHDQLDYLVVTPVPAAGKLVYAIGSAWDRGSAIRDAAAWEHETQRFAARVAAAVKVTVSPAR